ncbi:MAG: ATP-binding protein [Clostridia bacterium]|nr:ATP-binding protein [Clostridia bacterium]
MIKRNMYLDKIRDFYNEKSLIKIIYGLRRSGKSIILTQIIDELQENGIDEEHIIYINFESLDYSDIKDAKDLDKYIKSFVKDKKTYYIFLDEIQKVNDFEKGINSLRITNNFSIFITGSNSKMTFMELSTDLSGRYVSFRVCPLTFKEVIELTNTKKEDYEKLLFDVFEWGTLPQRFSFKDENPKLNYISDVYDSILLKDVIERMNIKDITSFNKILQYILEIEGREFSSGNVLKYLKQEYKEISTETLYNYIEALCSTFMINRVYRYDVHGKEVLKTLNKFYASDLGIKKIKKNNKEINFSTCLENLVYNELIVRGYEVFVGKTRKGEVDFIAIKNKEFKYIQVCLYLNNEETIQREFGAYDCINDNYPKYVISLDKDDFSKNGIKHINAIDFFLSDNF